MTRQHYTEIQRLITTDITPVSGFALCTTEPLSTNDIMEHNDDAYDNGHKMFFSAASTNITSYFLPVCYSVCDYYSTFAAKTIALIESQSGCLQLFRTYHCLLNIVGHMLLIKL